MAIHIECKKRDRSIIFINGNELIVEGRTDLKVNGWTVRLNDVKLKIKLNLWLTDPKGTTPVN